MDSPLWLLQKLQTPDGSFVETVGHPNAPLNTTDQQAPPAGLSPTLLPSHLVVDFTVEESTCCTQNTIH